MRKKARADQSPEGTSLNIAFVERQKAMRTMARSWKSKMGCYEIPCAVTGGTAKAERRLRGNTYQHPMIGLSERGKPGTQKSRCKARWTGKHNRTLSRREWRHGTDEAGAYVCGGTASSRKYSFIFDRAPCAVKAARTVLSGGKSGEKQSSKDYLSQSGAKSQGIKHNMAK